jgi:threonine dehydratase
VKTAKELHPMTSLNVSPRTPLTPQQLLSEQVRRILSAPVYDLAIETPLQAAPALSASLGNQVLLKREDLQPTFSFKIRGAYTRLARLTPAQRERGVITASAGNHAQGVALAASHLGIKATIVMPTTTPSLKIEGVRSRGGHVVLHGESFPHALAHALTLADSEGATFVPPYDDPDVIAGQGTVGMELWEDDPDLDTVLVATGGGGLIAGIASWYSGGIRVVSVEPEQSCCLAAAVKAGGPVDVGVSGAAADSLGARRLGALAYEIVRDHVAVAVTVTEADIQQAQRELWERLRLVAEPGGATAYAALVAGAYRPERGERVAVVVCGGNVDLASLPWA